MGLASLITGAVALTSVGGVLLGPVALLVGALAAERAPLERDRRLGTIGAWLGGAAFALWAVVLVVFVLTL